MTTTDPTLTHPDPTGDVPAPGRGSGTRGTRIVGFATIVSMGWLVAFGLGFSPEDRDQRESVRLLYVHVPTIWIAYGGVGHVLLRKEEVARLGPSRRSQC